MRYICNGCEVGCRLNIHSSSLEERRGYAGNYGIKCPIGFDSFRYMWVEDEDIDTLEQLEKKELRIAELIKERDTYHERLQDAHRLTEEWRNKYNELNANFEPSLAAAELEGFDRAQRIVRESNDHNDI